MHALYGLLRWAVKAPSGDFPAYVMFNLKILRPVCLSMGAPPYV